jgi:hypothetical protein
MIAISKTAARPPPSSNTNSEVKPQQACDEPDHKAVATCTACDFEPESDLHFCTGAILVHKSLEWAKVQAKLFSCITTVRNLTMPLGRSVAR